MAATQQLPSWMTLSTTVYTNVAGQTVTSETTLQLPLTYYGPSIPLGTDGAWTYGGLTSPAPSTSFVPTSSSTTSPSATSSATPSSISPSLTSATPSSLSSYLSSTPSTSTFTSTSSSTSATSSSHSTATALSKGALIGIIIGAIALFITLLLLFIWLVRSRRRDSRAITPIWTGWNVVTPDPTGDEESRPAGVGSPRDSGEEADPFLRQSTSGTRRISSSGQLVSPLPPGAALPHVMGSTGSDRTRSSGVSTDYGNVLPGSGHFGQAYNDDGFPALATNDVLGHIMPPGELLRIEDEDEPEEIPPPRIYSASHPSLPDHIAPLLPPPPFEGATRKPSDRSLLDEKEKSVRSASYPTSDMEDSKVFTARRVRVQELGLRGPQDDDSTNTQPVPGPSSWGTSLSRLRMSWFGSSSSRSASRSRSSRKESDQDAEAGQSLLGHRLRVGINPVGERPTSGVSAKSAVSGNTIYHDAVSQMGSPVSLPSRAMTPASQRGSAAPVTDFAPPVPSGAPPAYDDPYDSMGTRNSNLYPSGVDVLDIPAPAPFSSTSMSGSLFPPGLPPLSSRRVWRDSLSVITGSSNGAGITIDVLDAEPPRAGHGWRNLAGGLLGGGAGPDANERRTTSGVPQVIHQGNPMVSEQGSLHSMRSHLSPYSARSSSGSAPASSGRAFNFSGSNSSRPSANSAHSRVATASSGSLNSHRRQGPISPSVSAFGHADPMQYMSRATEEYEDPNTEPGSRTSILGPMPSFTSRSVLSQPTIRSVGATTVTSDDTEVTRTTITMGSEDTTSAAVPWFQEPMRAEI
ncbi:hypothetical protein K503DRAFT_854317 [Rhizopogon vinicolor AM-OR11-026]|uniref:Uncharacterized protein n=1 Tax=Rhizopogon vinicolor AM-OR11-026 TaxID=1314800 RepID=A0A1B7NAU8_9AGAM|nr:hypothetical protein K503DRAFT_854317 [Rhizopogon vinicolor AM-OR11-026]